MFETIMGLFFLVIGVVILVTAVSLLAALGYKIVRFVINH